MTDLSGQDVGRYHLVERLGEGGMAVVYKAYDTRLERVVAIKFIRTERVPPDQLTQMLARFEREAKALARMEHASIIRIFDYGEYNGAPYLVMNYLPGGTLKQFTGRQVPWQDAVRLILPVARALEYAHRQGIVHRDVKPANVLISSEGYPLLSDFGIARMLESETGATLTGTGVGIGTPEYMAPEQWSGSASPSVDIYALGVVLFELITGRVPYQADTPVAILIKQANDPLPRPSTFVRGLPEAVEQILFKALAKTPEERFPNMQAFVEAMERLGVLATQAGRTLPAPALPHSEPPLPGRTTPPPAPPPAPGGLGIPRIVILLGLGALLVMCLMLGIWQVAAGLQGEGLLAFVAPPTATLTPTLAPTLTLTARVSPPTRAPSPQISTPVPVYTLEPTAAKPPGEITLWYSFIQGGAEENALLTVASNAEKAFPGLKVTLQQFSYTDLIPAYLDEVAAGRGPDMILFPNDDLGNWARHGQVLRLDEYVEGRLGSVFSSGVDGMKVDGHIYGVPESAKAVALYYNKILVPNPPRTTDELLSMLKKGKTLHSYNLVYYLFGWSRAFGGQLLDENGRCAADRGGWVEMFHYLLDLKAAGAVFDPDFANADVSFMDGRVSMFISGPWSLPAYRDALGNKLGVVPLPDGPKGPAAPLNGIDGFYINPKSRNPRQAVELALFMTSRDSSQIFTDQAGHVPVRWDVNASNPLISAFAEVSSGGFPRPQSPEFSNFWNAFGDWTTQILDGTVSPEDGVAGACRAMNMANDK
ncbi:MAG TPA: serine/threonine-protein kinase [Anaerolineaceae bacterium]|nr:serine/threonine-protein kinase [Anaerolineaceae bacterium]HPN52161.1 serine/threonine-protein kinase [Anaerolineaceae bacterium]